MNAFAPSPPAGPAASERAFLGVERSATGRRWADRIGASASFEAVAMAQSHGLPEVLCRVLAGRGVAASATASFLDPTVRELMPDPACVTDMDRAAARIADAVTAGERIAVFGDYDVDGATSAALMARFLRHQGAEPLIYIPDRLFEGYGPNVEAMRKLAGSGARLVIAVDCGTTSLEAIDAGTAAGMAVVIIDHHQCGPELPGAHAVVNPNRDDDVSGLSGLAAVGLTFLTVVAVNRELRRRGFYAGRREPDLLAWLDLVALGTICDVVPLTGLNRAFVVKGLAALRRGENRGLAALAGVARLTGPVGCRHLSFLLGPRINAGGRIGNAALGARLLATDDDGEAGAIAAELDRLNAERQAMERAMVAEAAAEAEAEIGGGEGPPVLLASSTGWHSGVVGLIAGRLRERFRRPALAVAVDNNGIGAGSGRSIPGVDLGRAVRAAVDEGILVKGGGHAMAAGFTIEAGRLGDFRAFLAQSLSAQVREAAEGEALVIDAAMTARGATADFLELIGRAGPFGAGHPEPVFAFPAHRVVHVASVGTGHIRASLATGDGARIKAIAFGAAGSPLGDALLRARGATIHVAGTLALDSWQGRQQPALHIVDAAPVR